MSAAVDRSEVFAVLATDGPLTTHEVRRRVDPASPWPYARAWRALTGLEQRHWISAAKAEREVLWFLPEPAPVAT